jgi:CheR methyltransferase-like protein
MGFSEERRIPDIAGSARRPRNLNRRSILEPVNSEAKHHIRHGELSLTFARSEGGYRINWEPRKPSVFAPHDLTRDPPFSNLDLIICRNVMPYLKSAFQEKALAVFHCALKLSAFLSTENRLRPKWPAVLRYG